jgi:hypothetical protein
MARKTLALIVLAAMSAASVSAYAQGSGGGAGAAGSGGTSAGGSTTGGISQSSTTGGTGQTGMGSGMRTGSPETVGANRNQGVNTTNGTTGSTEAGVRGVGTAPNGSPVGSSGSGLGSPEQPYDVQTRR